LPFLACILLTISVFGQEFQEGVLQEVRGPAAVYAAENSTGTIWQYEIQRQQSSFLMLQFTDITSDTESSFDVLIRDRDNQITQRINGSDFTRESSYWTAPINSEYALVQVESDSPPGNLGFRIGAVIRERAGGKLLSIDYPDDRKHVAEYEDDLGLQAASRSVAKIVFVKGLALYSCSGFLISSNELVTNKHCVSSPATCRTTTAIFGYQLEKATGNRWLLNPGERYRCASVAPHATLDLAVLTLNGDPGTTTKWGHLSFDNSPAGDRTKLAMVQHPGGQAKQVAVDNCGVTSPDPDGNGAWFGHLCDTLNGSSGSPILNASYNVVGVHTLGFAFRNGAWDTEIRAIPTSAFAL